MTGGHSGPAGGLQAQAEDLLTHSTEPVELVTNLDFGYIESNDEYADWHASSPLLPMVRALFLKELEGYSFSELHRHLTSSPDDAEVLGFDEVPSRTTFGRAWRDRLDENLQHTIEYNARKIRKLAHEGGCSIGLDALDAEDKSGASERTQDRFINEKATEVTEEMQQLVFPAFDFDRAENAKYDADTHCELQSHMGLSASAAESGTDLFADDSDRGDTPDGDTHLHNIKRLDQEDIQEMVTEGIGRMVHEAKHHLEFDRPAEVAIDMTYVAYYGDRDELEMVMGAPATKEYEWCYKFATLTVVGENVKFTLAMRTVQKGDLVGEVVADLLDEASEHVSISTVYADSEFCSVDTIRTLEDAGLHYIIPSPKNKRVKREIERMDQDVEVKNDYGMYGSVSGGGTQKRAGTNLVLLPSTADEDKTVAFTTNKDVKAETETERRYTKGLLNRYSRRWGIENSYKTIKDFLAWTTSKDFGVRLFYFGFAVLLYNMWLLVDLLVQTSLDIDHRYKPRVTAKRFLNLARKQLTGVG